MPFPTITVTAGTGTTINTLPNSGQALAADSLPVVLTALQLAALAPLATVGVTGAFFQATQPVSAAALPLPAGASTAANQATEITSLAAIATSAAANATAVAQATGNASLASILTGVNAATPAGANVVGKVGIDQTTPGTTNAVQLVPGTTGGWSSARVKTAATTNPTLVKAGAGQIGGYALFNGAAAARFVRFFDLAAAPTVGTSTPLFTVILPAGGGANVSFPGGIQCAAGVAFDVTAGVADADATATAADDVHGTILYK